MKKIHSLFLAIAAAGTLSASAQQLPNSGFENWKGSCGSSESFGYTTGMCQRPGIEPSDWAGSSVNQNVLAEKKETLVFQTEGKTGYYGVQLTNKYVGVKFGSISIGSVAPGYISLGTPWVHAVTTISKCDGGTYGGADFTFRPDAISGNFKRTDTNDEVSHVIFYSWDGTFKSKVGEMNNPTNTRDNVDRAIMGRDNAYLSEGSNGTLIGKADYTFKSTTNSDWQSIEIPIEYVNDKAPVKYNVIICAGDYWTRANMKEDTDLRVDDVKLIYYSRLASLAINGTSVAGFNSNTYNYTIDSEMPDASAFTFTCMGNSGSGKATLSLDEANAVATVTVTNSNAGGEDVDGQTSHVYTLNFNKRSVEIGDDFYGVYSGIVFVKTTEIGFETDINRNGNVHIEDNGKNDGTCTFKLPDFALDDTPEGYIGDIVVENMNVANSSDGGYLISGSVNPLVLSFLGEQIVAKVNVTGTIDATGKIELDIAVIWLMDPEGDPEGTESGLPIPVEFNGRKAGSVGITDVNVDNENAPVELYNLNGVRVNAESVAPGLYIRRQGTEVTKIIVR